MKKGFNSLTHTLGLDFNLLNSFCIRNSGAILRHSDVEKWMYTVLSSLQMWQQPFGPYLFIYMLGPSCNGRDPKNLTHRRTVSDLTLIKCWSLVVIVPLQATNCIPDDPIVLSGYWHVQFHCAPAKWMFLYDEITWHGMGSGAKYLLSIDQASNHIINTSYSYFLWKQ